MRLLYDTEADGLLNTVTKVHCIGIVDVDTGQYFGFGPDRIDEALELLYEADEIIAHNQLDYDLRMLWKVKRWAPRPGTRRTDTLVIARLLHADIKNEDSRRIGFPTKLIGRHSLKAWGLRLGEPKGEYGVDEHGVPIPGCWDAFNEEMFSYMEQDCRTNLKLLQYLKPWAYPQVPLALEHRVQEITLMMTEAGWPFDVKRASELYVTLAARRDVLEAKLVGSFGSWQEIDKIFTPKRDNKTLGYLKGVEVTKMKTVTFNPGSRLHIEKKLREFGWKPTVMTQKGGDRAKVDEAELLKINIPEAKELIEFLLVQKRLGQLGDGANGWLKMVDEGGLMHGRYNPMGTVTGRASHYSPNLGQVPKVSAPYGGECRACFTVPKGWKLIGADLSGAQLRCLAHMVAEYDGGEYAKVVLDGDIHWHHVKAIRRLLSSTAIDKANPDHRDWREKAKTTIYAYLFGAQALKIGSIWFPSEGEQKQREWGQIIMDRLGSNVQGLGKIQDVIKTQLLTHKELEGLDGRLIPIRSAHSALNAVIQNAESVLAKTWLVSIYDRMIEAGFKWGYDQDFVIAGFIHDECQTAVRDAGDNVERASQIIAQAARDSGTPYGFRVRIDCDTKVGETWFDTH